MLISGNQMGAFCSLAGEQEWYPQRVLHMNAPLLERYVHMWPFVNIIVALQRQYVVKSGYLLQTCST
jgi:hypothetical protein